MGWEQWREQEQTWRNALAIADRALARLISQFGVHDHVILPNRWDEPERLLIESPDPVTSNFPTYHAVQLRVQAPELRSYRTGMTAWFDAEDRERNRVRHWCHVSEYWQEKHLVRIDEKDPESELLRVLTDGLNLARSWQFSDNEFFGEYIVTGEPQELTAFTQIE